MTKKEFVQNVAQKSGLTSRDAGKAVDAFMQTLTDALQRGETISLGGFGKFSGSGETAQSGVRPKTGGAMTSQIVSKKVFAGGSQLGNLVKRSR